MESWELEAKARSDKRKSPKAAAIHRFAHMSDPTNSDSPQVKLMHEWGQGFVKMKVDLIAGYLHKDYRHITYPQSLGMTGETREEYLKHMEEVIGFWTSNEVSHKFQPKFIPRYIPPAVDCPFDL